MTPNGSLRSEFHTGHAKLIYLCNHTNSQLCLEHKMCAPTRLRVTNGIFSTFPCVSIFVFDLKSGEE
jgi:hypothetical protein